MVAIRFGLRLKVAFALALACLLVVGALGITLFAASEEMEESLIEQIITEEMDYLVRRHREDNGYLPHQGSNLHSYIVRDSSEEAALPAYMARLPVGRHKFFVGEIEHHALVRENGPVRYLVGYEVDLHEQREQGFKSLLLLSVITAAIVSLALGYWLSGVLVLQVTELADRVGTLNPGGKREVLTRDGQDPEVATLARAFEDYQARIEQMIRREQEFTSNASHELRTPLTAIRTSCELLLDDATLPEKARARVTMIGDAAGRLTEQLQALLLLARGQALGETEPVAIADCVAEAAEPYRGEIARKGLAFETDVPRDAVLVLNYQALRVMLANLLRNAVHFTDRGFVRISYAAKRLTIADSGHGIHTEHLQHVFERFFRAEDMGAGTGVGLAIVKRICDHYGWKIEVESAPMKGSIFSITFP